MEGRVAIDGYDLYTTWGMFVAYGGYNGLLSQPGLKKMTVNEWQEYDGCEPDLSSPKLDTREFTITFGFHGMGGRRQYAFMNYLADGAYHICDFVEAGRQYKLRFVGQSSLSQIGDTGLVTIKFADDFPLWRLRQDEDAEFTVPSPVPQGAWQIGNLPTSPDTLPLEAYGVRVIAGSIDSLRKSPDVRPALKRNISVIDGCEYDGDAEVVFKTKDVTIQCLMRAESLSAMWSNYDWLLSHLTGQGDRTLTCMSEGGDMVYGCYYKSCTVSEFSACGKPWLKFALTLTLTSFRPHGEWYTLESETMQDLSYDILTEDNDTILITTNH